MQSDYEIEKIQKISKSLSQPIRRTSYFKIIYELDQLYKEDSIVPDEIVQLLLKRKPNCQAEQYKPTTSGGYLSILTRKVLKTELQTMQDIIDLVRRIVHGDNYGGAVVIIDQFQNVYTKFKTNNSACNENDLSHVLVFTMMLKALGNIIKRDLDLIDCQTRYGILAISKCRDMELIRTIFTDVDCDGIINKKLSGMAYSIIMGLKNVRYNYLRVYIDLSSQVLNIGDMSIYNYRLYANVKQALFDPIGLDREIRRSNVNSNNPKMKYILEQIQAKNNADGTVLSAFIGNLASSH